MRFTILTLFPEMIEQGLSVSILGRAKEKGYISFDVRNIRDYTTERHGHVDDAPYGGGAGMLMQADPILRCYRAVTEPQGKQFTQADAKMFAQEEELLILCGHYEGVDERALRLLSAEPYSIGDYVLTGGELPAMVMVDAISRMAPGVLSNQESGEIESFEGNLLEYPQYTRPEVYEGLRVPPVLLSGDHKKVAQWRREQALLRTRERRPDLFSKVELTKADRKFLSEQEAKEAEKSEG